jgi:hypothetical protein
MHEPWLKNGVDYFMPLGFFKSMEDMSFDARYVAIGEQVANMWDTYEVLDPSRGYVADLSLLTCDRDRVWFRDLEGAFPGENAYKELLERMSDISLDRFTPEKIDETWNDDGTADISFEVHGKRYQFRHAGGDMMDMGIRKVVNQALREAQNETQYAFQICDGLGMPNFVVMLSAQRRDQLVKERSWQFYDF